MSQSILAAPPGLIEPTFSPSCLREVIRGAFPAVMEDHDIRRICGDFAAATRRAREGDLDGVEISCQAGTLIEQFWSPAMNKRTDGYGGSLANRMRFGLEVLETVRQEVGDDYVVGIRMPGDEMLKDGLSQEDCVTIARIYASNGLIDFISVVGAKPPTSRARRGSGRPCGSRPPPTFGLARAIKQEVGVAVLHATPIVDAATAEYAIREKYIDMVGMTRAMLADPHYASKLSLGKEAETVAPLCGGRPGEWIVHGRVWRQYVCVLDLAKNGPPACEASWCCKSAL